MSDDRPTDAQLCGRLYAALEVLQRLGDIDFRALSRENTRLRASKRPRTEMTTPLHTVGKSLHWARMRGNGAAAGAVFRTIPDLMPSAKDLPGSLNPDQQQEFLRGREAGLEAIQKITGAAGAAVAP
ncbi:hypothetical protein ACFYXM_33340 [Streptomyces sp. NPDC002476]|uniref:hypothetical protein n=1 Tax=Streptomyces sp. NPDC002476 TaxID=3364648 RepID=UPI0036BBF165